MLNTSASRKHGVLRVGAAVALLASAAAVQIGEPAPNFGIVDSQGKTQHLNDYHGKYVVLEWHSQPCWAVKKHYASGNMQRLQKEWTGKGVVWLTVISSGPGNPGFMTPSQENAWVKQAGAYPTAVLMDEGGVMGHLYEATTTPQMFVIDPQGTLIYDGAIDDRPKPEQTDVWNARNLVSEALEEAMAGRPVSIPATKPYGCSVKYK
ncbi:MAG TPA: redoxin domain-containing protein [Candidatus Angelobacter sp.]|nr:redoxin domain-containing protein [Candidatus Angelobacter sp.]